MKIFNNLSPTNKRKKSYIIIQSIIITELIIVFEISIDLFFINLIIPFNILIYFNINTIIKNIIKNLKMNKYAPAVIIPDDLYMAIKNDVIKPIVIPSKNKYIKSITIPIPTNENTKDKLNIIKCIIIVLKFIYFIVFIFVIKKLILSSFNLLYKYIPKTTENITKDIIITLLYLISVTISSSSHLILFTLSFKYDKLILVIEMSKKGRKIMAWVLLILMVGSVIASLVGYALAAK